MIFLKPFEYFYDWGPIYNAANNVNTIMTIVDGHNSLYTTIRTIIKPVNGLDGE